MAQSIDFLLMLLVAGIAAVMLCVGVPEMIKSIRLKKMFNKLNVGDIYEGRDTVDCPYDEYKRFVRIVDKKTSHGGKKKYVKYEYVNSPLVDNVLEWEVFIRLYVHYEGEVEQ